LSGDPVSKGASAPTVADDRFILRGSKGPFPDRDPAQLLRARLRAGLA
jgi:hypothetical protein